MGSRSRSTRYRARDRRCGRRGARGRSTDVVESRAARPPQGDSPPAQAARRLARRAADWARARRRSPALARRRDRASLAHRPASRHRVRLDAGHARLSRRGGAALAAPCCRASIAELLAAFPYDFLYGSIAADTSIAKKYAAAGPPLSLVARRARDPRAGARRAAARVRARLPGASRGRRGRAQLLRAASARGHVEHRRRSATATGRAGSRRTSASACARRARELILLDHSRVGRASRPHPQPDDLQHADQPADLPRDGVRRRHRVVAAHLPADVGEEPLGPARRRCRPRT